MTSGDAEREARVAWARALIAPFPEPVLLVEAGRVAAANPAARGLLGEWIEGHDVRLALRHPVAVEHLSRASAPAEAEVEVAGIGQPDRRWLMSVAALPGGERLVRLSDRSEAYAAEKMRVDFVANASHELRTPLATVLGFIETLEDEEAGSDPELRSRFLGLMHSEAKRMQHLVEDLMSLSRIEAERFNPPHQPVDLLPLIDEVGTSCAQVLEERGNRLEVVTQTACALVPGDQGQLLQLLRNLVVNAVKYGRADAPVTVRLAEAEGGMLLISVSDRGEGIAAEHLPRLTERFYRVDAGRSRSVGGTGLGLAIVKHIVGRHRGQLEIRSVVGEGTTVEVRLPRGQES